MSSKTSSRAAASRPSRTKRGDHILVLGGGHNGLAAAAMLGKSGRKVTVLEARDALGGLSASHEWHPGFRVPGFYEDTSLVRPWVLESLDIKLARRPRATLVLPKRGSAEGEIRISPDAKDGLAGAVTQADKTAWADFRAQIDAITPALLGLLDRAPLSSEDSLWTLGRAAWSVRKLGKKTMMDLVRVAPMCVADFLRDIFPGEHRSGLASPSAEHLRAGLSYGALEGAFTGPWSAHTALLLLLREVLSAGRIEGGAPALVAALEAAARRHDVTLRTNAKVARILVGPDGVRGVRLASGEEISADTVLSTLDPKSTFAELIGPPWLPLEVADGARVYRMRGATAVVLLGLNGPLVTNAGTLVETLRTGETLDEVEKAFDAAKYRRFALAPALSVTVPSMSDASLAPAGQHVAVVRVHAAAYDLEGGWTESAQAACLEATLGQLASYCPRLREQVVAMQLVSPVELEARFGLHGGHLLHGEMAPDQLLSFRPSLATGRYATPIAGLFIGGGASHPGGGLTAGPGALAARAVLSA